ncbi:MAG: flavodoxin domain-containing protein [Bacilli bacterium]|nr:flavodoxin domain-containing protein [Bacilli bacterium]
MIKELIKSIGFKKKNIAIRYQSRHSHTKLVADVIATNLKNKAKPITTKLNKCDILYLGGGTYYGKIDKELKTFINNLDSKKVKEVVLFATSGIQSIALRQMSELLSRKGIKVNRRKLVVRMGLKSHWLFKHKLSNRQIDKIDNFVRKVNNEK